MSNVFTHNAYDPDPAYAALAANITYVVPAPVPGTTSTNNCFADNTYSSIVSVPLVTQANKCP